LKFLDYFAAKRADRRGTRNACPLSTLGHRT
jgi:hypothetical protein